MKGKFGKISKSLKILRNWLQVALVSTTPNVLKVYDI